MPESSARSRDVSASSEVLSSNNRARGRGKRARLSTSSADVRDDSSGPSQCLLGFVRVNARSLDEASTSAPKYEEPLECGQVRARDDARQRDERRRGRIERGDGGNRRAARRRANHRRRRRRSERLTMDGDARVVISRVGEQTEGRGIDDVRRVEFTADARRERRRRRRLEQRFRYFS